MKKRSTRMNTGRKRRAREDEIAHLRGQIRRLRAKLRTEEAKWFEKCPRGHLVRHDECDVTCWVTVIDPVPTPFTESLPKVSAQGTIHQWIFDKLVWDSAGWWWRVPYGWWLKLTQRRKNDG